jgi:hypothetical protein
MDMKVTDWQKGRSLTVCEVKLDIISQLIKDLEEDFRIVCIDNCSNIGPRMNTTYDLLHRMKIVCDKKIELN